MVIHHNGHTFDIQREMIDVTSLSRPDERWRFVDAAGHEHSWRFMRDGVEIQGYNPQAQADVPTVTFVQDGVHWYDDTESAVPYGHHECSICRERVSPAYRADDHRQYIAGLTSHYIDGQYVSREEFIDQAVAAGIAKREDFK